MARRERPPTGASWADLVAAAPELATAVRGRFAAHRHHVIGTIRRGGAPRLSGTEVEIDDQRLRVGMMAGSRKLADVERDPRVEIHSAPLELDLAAGDAKLSGRLRDGGPVDGQGGRWFELEIERVSLVRVDGDELDITTWRPGRDVERTRRR